MKSLASGILLALLALASARTLRQLQRTHFLGQGTNDIAINVLEKLDNGKQNTVFSPLGYSTLLTVLMEGARGNTRNQLVSVLKVPEDTYAVRSTFNRILLQMNASNVLNQPEFKNWFYVYKNYTVEESYKNTLKDNYLIEVKEVSRDYTIGDGESTGKPSAPEEPTMVESSTNTVLNNETEKPEPNSSEENDSKESEEEGNKKEDKSKEEDSSEEKDSSKKEKKPSNIMKIKDQKDSSKDEKENPKSQKDDTKEQKEVNAKTPEKVTSDKITENAQKVEPETTQQQQSEVNKVQVEPSPGPGLGSEMATSEVQTNIRTVRETVSAVATNHLSIDSEKEMSLKTLSRMIAFNALYFKGNWSTPFTLQTEKLPFNISPTEQVSVDMIHAEGDFETGRVPELDARALDIPYQGDRYSLLLLVPSGSDGLKGLLTKLKGFSFHNVDKHLTKLQTSVHIPKLKFYTISKPKDIFVEGGITDLFNQDADLSGISGFKGLYLEDLVQLVTFEIDENASSYNYLTSSQISELRGTSTPFLANQPFVFFLRDKLEDLNIVAGVVNNPLDTSK